MTARGFGASARTDRSAVYRIGIVIPLQGAGGIFGPSCMTVCELAKQELNAGRGVGGREVELVYIDGGQAPWDVVAEVVSLVDSGMLNAVTGWHISPIRRMLGPALRGRIPYVYTSLFEGGDTTRGVYCTGEVPEQQIFPALRWLRDVVGLRRWHLVGARYVWPLRSAAKIRDAAAALDIEIVGMDFVNMGDGAQPGLTRAVSASDCEAVLMLFVGQDAVDFNRSFAAAGLDTTVTRYSPLMEENMLLASGAGATDNLFVSASFFRSLASRESLDFVGRYVEAHGPVAPALNNMAESCYQGIQTLAELARRAGGVTVADFDMAIDGLSFNGPRGPVQFVGNQATQQINLARADTFDFEVLTSFPAGKK